MTTIGSATILNASIVAGDTWYIEATCTDEDGDALDLTGSTIEYALKATVEASAKLVDATTANGKIAISGASSNIFTVTVAPASTASLAGPYYHEAEVTLLDGQVFTAFLGTVTIQPTGV